MPEARILIVDDTRANLVALQVLLKPVEADVLIAESGQQALLLAAENKENIALLLLDVLITDIDGETSLITKIESLLNEASRPLQFNRGQYRYRTLSGSWRRRRNPAAPRRPGHVPGEATGQEYISFFY